MTFTPITPIISIEELFTAANETEKNLPILASVIRCGMPRKWDPTTETRNRMPREWDPTTETRNRMPREWDPTTETWNRMPREWDPTTETRNRMPREWDPTKETRNRMPLKMGTYNGTDDSKIVSVTRTRDYPPTLKSLI